MIQEDYVSFEVAKLLKEKGFDYKTEHRVWYVIKQFSTGCHWNACTYKVGDITREYNDDCCIPMPTHQMAMKWLREVYKLSIEPYSIAIEKNCIGYAYAICSCKTGLEIFAERWDGKNPFVSYEEAVEAALKYCLGKLKLI